MNPIEAIEQEVFQDYVNQTLAYVRGETKEIPKEILKKLAEYKKEQNLN